MSDLLIFDTSVLVDQLRTGCHRRRIEDLKRPYPRSLRCHGRIVARRRNSGGYRVSRVAFARNHPTITPTQENWLESGKILEAIRGDCGLTADKLRDLHFDVLIALTARSNDARLITSIRADFEMIDRYRKLQLEIW